MSTTTKRSDAVINEEDVVPLVKPRSTASNGAPTAMPRSKCLVSVLIGAILVTIVVFFFVGQDAEESSPFKVFFKDCKAVCSSQKQQRIERFGADILDSKELLKVLSAARDKAIQSLKADYGEKYFSDIFEEEKDGKKVLRKAFVPANSSSTHNLKRKLQLKILRAQIALQAQQRNTNGGCNCAVAAQPPTVVQKSNETGQRKRRLNTNDTLRPSIDKEANFAKFIWSTGGHSAAAAHGNLYNESYTAFMERAAKDVFASVGIELVGKNYAMGAMKSSPELALCAEAIYGSDADVVSWDFGMTDSCTRPHSFRMFFYISRASLIPSHPALIGLHTEFNEALKIYSYFGDNGIPGFLLDPSEQLKMRDGVPETKDLTTEQLNALPPFVRNFKCEDKLEAGEPFCDSDKYTNDICTHRSGKASWHPGWRYQALVGNAMALFLITTLVDAAEDLTSMPGGPNQLLSELQELEDADYNRFLQSALPESLFGFFGEIYGHSDRRIEFDDAVAALNVSMFFRGPAICHTALLPAETRYLGYVTESESKGFWDVDSTAISREEADNQRNAEKDKLPMRLVYDKGDRQQCPVLVNVDYKDYFYTSYLDGWTTMTIPNDFEAKAYRYDSSKVQGVVVTCFGCVLWVDYGCNKGDLIAKEFHEGKFSLEVNGEPVTTMALFHRCHALKGKDGFNWKPNSQGKFTLRARVNEENSFLRFTSVIVL